MQVPQPQQPRVHFTRAAARRQASACAPGVRCNNVVPRSQAAPPLLPAVASTLLDSAALLTVEEVTAIAQRRGLTLSLTSFGPFFKVVCRRSGSSAEDETALVGVLEGFAAPPPFAILHLDSVRVYNRRLSGPLRERAQTAFGLALLIGSAAFAHGASLGCTVAELLAIDDENGYAERLVRYYSRLGFSPVREVGSNGLRDLPDLLVWGGAGTRMDGDVRGMLGRWSKALRRQEECKDKV